MNSKKDGSSRATAPAKDNAGQPMEGVSYEAELRDWAFHIDGNLTMAVGRVVNDRKARWPDGYAIITSPVLTGAHEQDSVISTRNTRYLLSGRAGNLEKMLRLAREQAANATRRTKVAADERLFDLLQAAWGMDDASFEAVAGLPAGWLGQWRNHYRAPTDAELTRVRRLASFHDAVRLVTYGEPNYAAWWRRSWKAGSFIGDRSPIDAVLKDPTMLDRLEQYLRAQM